MKLTAVVVILTVLLGAAHGLPVEPDNGGILEGESTQPRILPFLNKRIKGHKKRLFQIGEGLIGTSKQAVTGIGTVIQSGDIQGPFLCTGCKAAVETLRFQVQNGREDSIYSMIENTCVLLNIQTKDVCSGIARLFGPELIPLLKTNLDGSFICSFLLTYDCIKIDLPEWEIPLPVKSNERAHYSIMPTDYDPKLKVLHLTDTHYDRSYMVGARVDCREPLCCRVQNGLARGREKGAGKWGDWNCDIPERTLDNMLQHAATTHPDIDYIIWTGDIPAHDIWNQSKQANLEILHSTAEKVLQYFPNTPVFPAVGNHESAPTDNFPPPGAEKSPSWLYDELQKTWAHWLPDSTADTIKKGGFYTALIHPGFRVVSLNTNYCYHRNWWLIINSTDPAGQLKWLVDVLHKAEQENEKVQIIAHVPPGQTDCLPTWRDNYYRIVSRFNDTIVGHFYGHTHKDEFEIYYDDETEEEPVGVGYIGPSVTTFTSLNPGYRIYYVDGNRENSTRDVLDYENWVLDLEYTNKNDEPKWSKSYSAKEEFGIDSLSPKSWNELYQRLKSDNGLLQRYYLRSNKDSPEAKKKGCDRECKKAILCAIRSCHKYD